MASREAVQRPDRYNRQRQTGREEARANSAHLNTKTSGENRVLISPVALERLARILIDIAQSQSQENA
jgi:hypothetical protein